MWDLSPKQERTRPATWPEETGGPGEKLRHRGPRWGHLSWTREARAVLALKRQEKGPACCTCPSNPRRTMAQGHIDEMPPTREGTAQLVGTATATVPCFPTEVHVHLLTQTQPSHRHQHRHGHAAQRHNGTKCQPGPPTGSPCLTIKPCVPPTSPASAKATVIGPFSKSRHPAPHQLGRRSGRAPSLGRSSGASGTLGCGPADPGGRGTPGSLRLSGRTWVPSASGETRRGSSLTGPLVGKLRPWDKHGAGGSPDGGWRRARVIHTCSLRA